ncbi:hypothetical protein QYE76_069938 [Lolium multiflorum]|uniref:UDP-glycosyltransferases domain-containing protein n=1 Tax=Lolium multiflorum TaxID=4521 RepID=A0AAD8SIE9_LOLMU|nr:hypothetical protein QYE76_069938 [Lolium multiflorum]
MVEKFRAEVVDSSSDEESDQSTHTLATTVASMIHKFTSNPGRCTRALSRGAPKTCRGTEEGQVRLHNDYFHLTNPVFSKKLFRHRYRMSTDLFLFILRGVRNYDPYFQCRPDATGALGFTSYQKCSAAIHMLSYGMAADIFDEYGIDCMHWGWKNCPFGWQGQYNGHEEGWTVILEAVISQDLWIWHSFFGMAGSNNDINVLHRSPVFNRLMQGKAPWVSYEVNGNAYDKPYYLADGIYPDWATLVKTIRNPNSEKTRRFAKMQEACRKDVERGFGVLQTRWAIVRHPARTWSLKTMHEVMTCCVIMHNMIVKNEHPDVRNENHWEFQASAYVNHNIDILRRRSSFRNVVVGRRGAAHVLHPVPDAGPRAADVGPGPPPARHPADAVVFDGVLPWAATAAPELGIPRYAFTGTGCFALSVQRSLLLHTPQDRVASPTEPFLVPGLPDAVRLTRSRLAEATLPGADSREFMNRMFDIERATAGWVVNSFAGLEERYMEHYEKDTGKPVFAVGPVCLVNGDGDDVLERGRGGDTGAAAEAARVLEWLDRKPARSVVYVCFGSLTRFPREQVAELGMGLADSGANFVWVIGDKNAPPLPDVEAAAGGRGLLVRGWAPQVAVLRHAAVGAFVTHCGWGAVTEAASAGVPVVAWPVFAEHFYNEALVVGVAGTGVSAGAERGYVWGGEELGWWWAGRRWRRGSARQWQTRG